MTRNSIKPICARISRSIFPSFVVFLFAAPCVRLAGQTMVAPSKPSAQVSYKEFPLEFEPTAGQTGSVARYTASGSRFEVALERDRAVIDLAQGSKNTEQTSSAKRIELQFIDANPAVKTATSARQEGVSNYLPASDRSSWRMNVPHFGRVDYSDIYPAIDLSFYGRQSTLEYDFRVKAGADSRAIQIGIHGPASARINDAGSLELSVDGARVEFLKPVAYQFDRLGNQVPVAASYSLRQDGSRWLLSFAVGAHDSTRDLVIDPVFSYGEQLPSTNTNVGAIAADAAGDTFITGQNSTKGFYVEKFSPAGKSLFNTVVGSATANAYPTGIAVDASGNSYVVGYAYKGLPATSGAYLNYAGKYTAPFVAVVSANGATVSYLSYLGGTTGYDYSTGIAVDGTGKMYVTGYENSTDFPVTAGAYLKTNLSSGGSSVFVAKFDPAKSGSASLVYSTLLDGAGVQSFGSGIAVDSTGNAYIALESAQNYPVTNGAFSYNGSVSDAYTAGAYLTKLNPTGTGLVYSAYLGPGTGDSVAIDTSGDAYVTGTVNTEDFPTTSGAYQTSYPGGFVSELNPAGSSLIYSTFLGGPSGALNYSGQVTPQQIVLIPGCASACAAYVSGWTAEPDFPAVNAVQSNAGGLPSAFMVELSGNGASALYSTYLGGLLGSVTYGYSGPLNPTPSAAVDSVGNAYLAANISGSDYPSTYPLPTTANLSYIAEIAQSAGAQIVPSPTAVNFDNYVSQGEAVGVSSTVSGIPVPLQLRNLGSTAAAISALTFSPSTEFSETDTCAGAIPAGGVCTLNLALKPTASGKRTATLSIASNGLVSPVTVALSGTAYAAGYLQTSAAELNFSDQAQGTSSAQQMLTITNIGLSLVNLQPILVSSVRQNEGNGSDFQVLNNCPAQLAAGASCSVGIVFTPLATGLRAASFYLQGDGFGNQTIYLNGTGIAGTSNGSISLSATTLNFNTQLVNTTSAQQTITFTNTSVSPVSIYSVSIATSGQTVGSDFAITGGNCNNASVIQVAPQATCTLSVRFTPTSPVAETGLLTFNDSSAGAPHTVALTGIGLAAAQALEFAPASLVYPDQPVGVPSAAQVFYVYNTSTGPVTIDRVLVTGDYQLVSSNCPGLVLKPGPAPGVDYNFSANCNVRLTFTPTATGTRNGTLTFVDNAGGAPQVLSLSGTGITPTGQVFIEPTLINFGAQAQGTTSATQHLTILNPGNSPVTINNVTTTGDYAIVNPCAGGAYPYVLGAQRTCGVDVSFTPTSVTNPRAGTVVVNSTGGNTSVPVTGSGVAALNAVGIAPTSLNFGSIVLQTQSFAYSVYFRNTGTEAVTLVSGAATGDYLFTGGSCGFYGNTLAPGASCYVQVYFTPTAAGTRTGTLTLVSSAATITAALTGVGTAASPSTQIVPNGVAFDQVAVGGTSASNAYIVFHNFASTSLAMKTVKVSTGGSNFLISMGTDSCTGVTIAANSQCSVQLQFAPTAAGYLTGTLTFTDAKSTTYNVPLAAYAPAVSTSAYLDPSSLSFPGQVLTTFSAAQIIYLVNSSDVPMTVGQLSGTNTSAGSVTTGAFSVNLNGGSDGCSTIVVAPRGKCQVYVIFGPTAAGSTTGTLVFPVTYANSTTATFTANLSGTGLAVKDSAEVYPTAVNFPDQAIGATYSNGADAAETITVVNTGNLPITIGVLTGTDTVVGTTTSGDFTTASAFGGADGCSNQSIAPGSYCQVYVGFNPSTAAAKSGKINFPVTYADKTTTTLVSNLTGKGVADGSKVVVSPASGQFDVQVIGTTSDSSEVLTFTLSNAGNLPVKIATSTVTSNFSFVSDGCSGTTVPINSSCQIILAFSPTKTGAITGFLTIPDNALGNPHRVALSGTGIASNQQVVLSQTAVNFGNQVVATKGAFVYVYVSNQSGATVPINSVVLAGTNKTDFIESDSCSGQSLSGHQNCAIVVQFAPAAASLGVRTATVTESDTASGSPRVITLSGTGVASAPGVAFYPASLDFGSQGLNTKSAPLTFSVTNTGASNLSITKVASTNATEFQVKSTNCVGTPITPGGNCLVSVIFDPNAGSTQTASIQITDNATGSPQAVTVTGLSVGIPQAKLSATSLAFGSQGVGIPSTAQTVTLSNPGTDTLQIAGIGFTGTNPGDFKQTNTCGSSIVAGANCTISVVFNPAAVGARSATLTLTDNASNTAGSTQTVAVSGTGIGVAKIAFNPTSLAFSSTNVGSSSAAKSITVSNPGTSTLSISSISVVPAGDFTETTTCGASVASGGTCTISVTFSPKASGARTAAISVADNAASSPQTVALSGTAVGVAQASLSTTALNFNNQAIGIASAPLPVTLTNTGTGNLVVTLVQIVGTNFKDFSETSSTCPGTLAPAAACTINVVFKPTVAGARTATLNITDNTGNVAGTTQAVTLSGTGTGTPQATFNPGSFAFASDKVGTPEGPVKVNLTNGGNGPLSITSIAITGTNAADFLEFDDCQPTVAVGATCEIALYFTPQGAGARTASVVVTDNAGGAAGTKQTLAVTGTGTGTPAATLSSTSLSFPTTKVGSQSNGLSVTLANTGNIPLSLASVVLGGTNPGDFSEFNSCPATLNAGDSCVIVGFFKPAATGARKGTITLTDNANGVAGTTQVIQLAGTGN